MEKSVSEALSATVSTERGQENITDTVVSGAEKRSLRSSARPTTVSNIEEPLSIK
jgi:hypothetical protein